MNQSALAAMAPTDPFPRPKAEHVLAPPIYRASASRAGNPNLHAQAGQFTYTPITIAELNAPIDRDPFDNVVGNIVRAVPQEKLGFVRSDEWPVMRRLSLPITQAPRLLRLLAYEEVSGSKLFPGYGGVALALRERKNWDLPQFR